MKQSHRSSNYFFRKSPSHYHMMLLIMSYHKQNLPITVEELKTKLFKTSRPKSALIINEACEKGFFYLEKAQDDQRKKNIKPTDSFVNEFEDYLKKLNGLNFYIESFFDEVMINDKEEQIKLNRLSLLALINKNYTKFANFN